MTICVSTQHHVLCARKSPRTACDGRGRGTTSHQGDVMRDAAYQIRVFGSLRTVEQIKGSDLILDWLDLHYQAMYGQYDPRMKTITEDN